MNITLKPHQEQGVEVCFNALRNFGSSIDASETGTGKSASLVGLCKRLNAKPAIITRKAVIPAWEETCKAMGVTPLFITNYEQIGTKGFPFADVGVKTVSVGGEMRERRKFNRWIIPEPRVIFCYDEAQALRGKSTFASEAALAAAKHFKTCLLSATPFQNPMEAKVIGRILKVINTGNEWQWLLKHGCRKDYFGRMKFIADITTNGRSKEANAAEGRKYMQMLHRELFPEHGYRVTRDVIPGFPQSQITAESVETGNADKITQRYLDEIALLRERDHQRATADVDPEFAHMVEVLPVVVNLRLRQEIELLKVNALVEMAQDAINAGDSVAIFVNFDGTIEVLKEKLKTNLVIRGCPGPNELPRGTAINCFQANQGDVIIVNSAAGGAGLSLHDPITQKPRTALICPTFSAVQLRQIAGRVWRLGGGFSRQRLVFAHGTVEDNIMAVVRERNCNLDLLLDGDLDVSKYL